MRILLISTLLVATASCAWPPPPPAEVAAAAPPAGPVFYVPNPFAFFFAPILPGAAPPPGRLTLSNFSFDHARVEAVITPYPDCVVREGTAASSFDLPLNGTRVIEAAPGADVCWRRQTETGKEHVAPSMPGWTEWNRVFLSSVPVVDTRL